MWLKLLKVFLIAMFIAMTAVLAIVTQPIDLTIAVALDFNGDGVPDIVIKEPIIGFIGEGVTIQ